VVASEIQDEVLCSLVVISVFNSIETAMKTQYLYFSILVSTCNQKQWRISICRNCHEFFEYSLFRDEDPFVFDCITCDLN
jgi:hypothetical protein